MNLLDIRKQAVGLKEQIKPVEELIKILDEIIKYNSRIAINITDILLNNNITGNANDCMSYANKVKTENLSGYDKFLQDLRNINFSKVTYNLTRIKEEYFCCGFETFLEEFMGNIDKIHTFISYIGVKGISAHYGGAITAINNISYSYRLLCTRIEEIENISDTLSASVYEESLRIRLLSENNSVARLIENMVLIQSIYNSINNIIGNKVEKELAYRRAESGTFEIDLIGCIQTLTVMGPILAVSYKVYADQFSPKAKLERRKMELENLEKDIKTRGDYIKLIKESCPDKTIDFSNQQIQDNLLNLELDIEQLYSKNPCIKVNDDEIGVVALSDSEIPIQHLEKVSEKRIEENVELNDPIIL